MCISVVRNNEDVTLQCQDRNGNVVVVTVSRLVVIVGVVIVVSRVAPQCVLKLSLS